MTPTVYIIGQAPARSGDGLAFTGPSGKRLIDLLGFDDYDQMVSTPNLVLGNLIDREQERRDFGHSGDRFDRERAQQGAIRLKAVAPTGSIIVCCGRNVGDMMGLAGVPYYMRRHKLYSYAVYAYVMPHPSGASHYWNDPDRVEEARRFLRDEIRPLLSSGASA